MKHHRLKELLSALDVKPGSFEVKYLGEQRAKNIYNWLDGEFKMKDETVDKIIDSVKRKRPDFNPSWFREGKGPMFGDYMPVTLESREDALIRELEKLKQEFDYVKRENTILKSFLREKGVDLGKANLKKLGHIITRKVGVCNLRLTA